MDITHAEPTEVRPINKFGRILVALAAMLVLVVIVQQAYFPNDRDVRAEGARMAQCMANERITSPMNTEAQHAGRCRELIARR